MAFGVVFVQMSESDEEFWDRFRATWPDMYAANALIHAGASDAQVHEALCAKREGRVADLEDDGHDHTRKPPEPTVIRIGAGNAHFVRRADESDEG
jgi:hypothetical protein